MRLSRQGSRDSPPDDARSRLPLHLMRLEERVVLDAACAGDSHLEPAGAEATPAHPGDAPSSATNEVPMAPEVPAAGGSHPGDAEPAGEVAEGAIQRAVSAALDAGAESSGAPLRVLAISSEVRQAETLAAAAVDGVTSTIFDAQRTSLEALVWQIREALVGRRADSIALATHGVGDAGFELSGGHFVTLESLQNPEMRAFWIGLAELLEPGGRIDLLACDAAAGPDGAALVRALEDLTGVNFAASADATGNAVRGGDWTLETDGVDAGSSYFGAGHLTGFTELLDSAPTLTDTNPGHTAVGTAGPVVVDAGITVDDGDGGVDVLRGATVRIKSGFVAAEDRLSFDAGLATSFGVAGSYDAATGELILIGDASAAEYQQVLRSVTYENSSATPDTTPREIFFTIGDDVTGYAYHAGAGSYYRLISAPLPWATAAANAAASSFGGLPGYLATITSAGENAVIANLIPVFPLNQSVWLGGGDAAAEGAWIWVTGPESGTQFWQGDFTGAAVGGMFASWMAGQPDDAGGADYLEILRTGLWRDRPEAAAPNGYIVEYGGLASDAEGQLTASVTLNVVAPNHAPVLDSSGVMSLTAIDEDAGAGAGDTVAGIIASAGGDRITDYNPGALEGVAIIGSDDAHGTWQFSTDGGASWQDLGAVGNDHALLLRDTDLVRFQPDADYSGTIAPGISFRAWDRTAGSAGTYADTTIAGGDSAFSVASESASLVVRGVNDAPTVANPLGDQSATEDVGFRYQFATDTFVDVDATDSLAYHATLADGSALPAWLSFDSITRTFTGTPTNEDVGTLNIRVTADDGHGGTVSDVFALTVANVNDAPTVVDPLVDQSASADVAFAYQFASDSFADVDADDVLSFTATRADGSALPAWLVFDPATRTFSGTPGREDAGTLDLVVTAADGHGGTVSDAFVITVTSPNGQPTVANPLVDQVAMAGALFGYQVTPGSFTDPDPGQMLTYRATLADGSALPAWLAFDRETLTFTGTPGGGDVGALSVVVTAEDGHGGRAADMFTVTISAAPSAEPPPPVTDPDPPIHVNGGSSGGSTGESPGTSAPPAGSGADGAGTVAEAGVGLEAEGTAAGSDALDDDTSDVGGTGPPVATGDSAGGSGAVTAEGGPEGSADRPAPTGGREDEEVVVPRGQEEFEELGATRLAAQIRESMLGGDVLDDESQPEEFREAWNAILGTYADSGEELAAYLRSAFRTVTESAYISEAAAQSVAAMNRAAALATEAGIRVDAEALLTAVHEAREDVKAASAELEAAIRTAARAGREERFDQVLDDVISAALQRLMTANERLFVETEALTAAAAVVGGARDAGGGQFVQERIAAKTAEARAEAQLEFTELRESWDRVARDVFAAFLERLVAEHEAGGRAPGAE